jgi:hypothetical protein
MDEEILSIFRGTHPDKAPCADCGGVHERSCGRVKRKAFHPNGNLAEVEYWPDDSWDKSDILWPEDAFEDGNE